MPSIRMILTPMNSERGNSGSVCCSAPSINDVTHDRGRGVVQNVTIVPIGCVIGTVTRGRDSKNRKFSDVI